MVLKNCFIWQVFKFNQTKVKLTLNANRKNNHVNWLLRINTECTQNSVFPDKSYNSLPKLTRTMISCIINAIDRGRLIWYETNNS